MGLDLRQTHPSAHLQLSKDEINLYVKRFQRIDIDKKGYITVNDLRRHMKVRIEFENYRNVSVAAIFVITH